MMMMMMTSVILGPFGNYLVPLMIGSRRMAYPRLEALSFWITPAAFIVLLSAPDCFGGFPTGWDWLRAAVDRGRRGTGTRI